MNLLRIEKSREGLKNSKFLLITVMQKRKIEAFLVHFDCLKAFGCDQWPMEPKSPEYCEGFPKSPFFTPP